jgi:hypothetical protein
MISEVYTSQMEDLASHGYVVAAMTHSYDGFLAVFPDWSYIAHDTRRWPTIPSFEGEANLNQLEWHTYDISVVLDQLGRLNGHRCPDCPLRGVWTWRRSGRSVIPSEVAAAHACQKDQRIKACLNQDGAIDETVLPGRAGLGNGPGLHVH